MLNVLLAVRLLGLESYGLLATLLSISALYLSLNSSVFTIHVIDLMASARDRDQRRKMLGGVCLAFVGSIALLCLGGGGILYAMELMFGGGPGRNLSAAILMLTLCLTGLQVANALQVALLESTGRLHVAMKLQMLSPMLIVCGLLLEFSLDGKMSAGGYVSLLVLGALLELVLLGLARRLQGDWEHVAVFSSESVGVLKQLVRSAGLLQGASMMNLFLEPANKLLLNYFLGPAMVAIYDLAMKVIWGIQNLFSAAMRVFLHIGSQQPSSLGSSFHRAFHLVLVPAMLMHVVGALFLSVVGNEWLGISLDLLLPFYAIAVCSNLMMILVTPLYIGLIGRRDLVFVFRTQAILAATNVTMSLLMIPFLGLHGSALGLLGATIYNVTSILWRCRVDLGGWQEVWLPRSRWELARCSTSAGLLALSILWGMFAYGDWVMLGVVMSLLVAVGICDPLVSLMYQRLWLHGKR